MSKSAERKLQVLMRYGSHTAKVEVRRALKRWMTAEQSLESVRDKRARRRRAKFVASLGAVLAERMSHLQALHDGPRLVYSAGRPRRPIH